MSTGTNKDDEILLERFLTNCRDISDKLEMSGLVLSGGTLLSVLQGKKVYQPIWQIIATNNSQANGNPSSQILLSDGELICQAIVREKCYYDNFFSQENI